MLKGGCGSSQQLYNHLFDYLRKLGPRLTILKNEMYYYIADYITVNISSPNTQDLRSLQQADILAKLLDKILTARLKLQEKQGKYVPIFIKLSPDLSDIELKQTLNVLMSRNIDGVITTNTTIWRPDLKPSNKNIRAHDFYQQTGGLSGEPLFDLSLECLKKCVNYVNQVGCRVTSPC